ncbi:MAG TPA: 50S ribosomal protein L9 [Leptospiraceae bacterium]|nr:50S ribosomal protein L9 [Leptospiraceae bacterium]HMW07930.1 50S ribosomal protein L9 [Leptospiraceae bacterium]HMX34469.1 50S ribosomal protein L9 [Leptospiraceae bacterium]HMY34251.1 50S ribosomal protein L9 [Leptospiraceae bacterium]HMZ64709.1 50S ribosomal protein L9 [Leptospiraceae bacterium]
MKVILQKDVTNLGEAGDQKEVADGYARNYLLPNRLAIRANEGSAKVIEHQRKLAAIKKEKRVKSMQEIAKSIEGKEVQILVKVGENDKLFGSVTAIDIANALKKDGIDIDKRKIEVAEHIKALGSYEAKVKLAEGINPKLKIKVEKSE